LLLMLAPLLAAVLLGTPPAAATGAPCDERGSRELVVAFINAFNRGDVKRLNTIFARGMWWRWYSVSNAPGRRIQTAAYNRKTLIAYFRTRHKQHERLQLQSLQFNGRSSGFGHFEYELLRRADDIKSPTPRPYAGKGAVSCWAGKLSVWSMGEEA
jgi:hypothetical protein